MNKLKIFLLYFSLLLSIISEPLWADGFASVSSGVSISASPVTLGKNFSIGFSLREIRGQPKTFENVAIAILDPSGRYAFDFAMYTNVKLAANGTYTNTATNTIFTNRPAGTYKVVIRGKFAGSWFDFNTTGSGINPKLFSVVAATKILPPPPPPAIPLAPTLNNPYNGQPNIPKNGITFSWNPSARATNYRILISQNSSFSGFNPSTLNCDGTCGTTTTTGTSHTRNLLLDGTPYYWKVLASNATGSSGWSSPRSFKTSGVAVSPLSAKVDAFVNIWKGKKVDFDGVYGAFAYQCVDLVHRYAQDVLGLNGYLATGNAYNVYLKTNNAKFTKVPNTPTGVPKKGDIIFWSGSIGHVAIFISGNASSFTSFDQNWPLLSAPHIQTHNYTGVVGWLHPNL